MVTQLAYLPAADASPIPYLIQHAPAGGFHALTEEAQRQFKLPYALISFVDRERLFYKSCTGLALTDLPRSSSPCSLAIRYNNVTVIPDISLDARFRNSPLAAHPPFIKFYAAAPIIIPDGLTVGTFVLLDNKINSFSYADIARLESFADRASQLVQRYVNAVLN